MPPRAKHNIAVPLEEARQNTKVAAQVVRPLAAVLWGFAFWNLAAGKGV